MYNIGCSLTSCVATHSRCLTETLGEKTSLTRHSTSQHWKISEEHPSSASGSLTDLAYWLASEMSGNWITCACNPNVGLTTTYYIQYGHVSGTVSLKNNHGLSSKTTSIIARHVKVQEFKSLELLLLTWTKITQKPFAAYHKLRSISQDQQDALLFSQKCRSPNDPVGKVVRKYKEKREKNNLFNNKQVTCI